MYTLDLDEEIYLFETIDQLVEMLKNEDYKIGDKELQACEECEGIEEMEFKGYDITKVPIKEIWECKNCNKINELHIITK